MNPPQLFHCLPETRSHPTSPRNLETYLRCCFAPFRSCDIYSSTDGYWHDFMACSSSVYDPLRSEWYSLWPTLLIRPQPFIFTIIRSFLINKKLKLKPITNVHRISFQKRLEEEMRIIWSRQFLNPRRIIGLVSKEDIELFIIEQMCAIRMRLLDTTYSRHFRSMVQLTLAVTLISLFYTSFIHIDRRFL